MNKSVKSTIDHRPSHDYVCVAGYGWSGSSAVVDILREFKSCYTPEVEFRAIKDPYGLIYLYYAVAVTGSFDIAAKDFIKYMSFLNQINSRFTMGLSYKSFFGENFEHATKDFIASLVSFEYYNNWWMFDFRMDKTKWLFRRIVNKILNKLHLYRFCFPSEEKSYFTSVNEHEFLESARKYIDDIFTPLALHNNASHIVLDQAVSSINFRNELNFFRKAKMIVVDRDPRDNYADLIQINYSIGKEFAKSHDTSKYIEMHRASRRNRADIMNDPDVLLLKFEDLVYHYEDSLKKIADFIGLNLEDHVMKRKYFNPDVSVKNVGIWHELITEAEADAIVSELEDYCYNRD